MVYVFGNSITYETLRRRAEYQGRTITLEDLASEALLMKDSEDKDAKVRQQAEKFMEKAGSGAATVCLIYNATGDSLTFVTNHDWSGHIGFAPYPPLIENGQWGAFLHLGNYDSVGAVVYRGKNKDGEDHDWMQAWTNDKPNNKAYSEIREVGHWTNPMVDLWPVVYAKMGESGVIHIETHDRGRSTVGIGNNTCSIFEAVLMHPNN